jgi:hypothetical protein
MNTQVTELPPRPPGAVKALLSGFNAVAGNIKVILLPVVLDLFLWLGPRLTLHSIFPPFMDFITRTAAAAGQPTPPWPQPFIDFATNYNFFSYLRTFPLGIFSLMLLNLSAQTPLGARISWDIPNGFVTFVLPIVLIPLGCLLGSLYFYMVSRAALQLKEGPGLLRAAFHSMLLAGGWQVFFVAAFFVILLPCMFILEQLSGNFLLSLLFFMLVSWPITWLGLLVFFSSHAVFTGSRNAFSSFGQTFRMLRFGMPPMGWFALMALVISRGMDMLWLSAPAESWMMLVGILGHAFVSTGLLAASFIFYRDLSSWVEEALQWLNTHQITSARA